MRRLVTLSVLLGFCMAVSVRSAVAVSIQLAPASPTIVAGETVSIDVSIAEVIPGGPPSVGAFDLDVTFDSAMLTPTGITFGPFLGDTSLFEALTDVRLLVGVVNLAEVSLLSPAQLDALQPDIFTLATLSFTALASGTTTLAFSDITVDDAFGNLLIGTKVSEPSALLLLCSGLAGLLGVARWRRQLTTPSPLPQPRVPSVLAPDPKPSHCRRTHSTCV